MTFKKGKSGNPKGRPRSGMSLTDLIKEKLDKEDFVDKLIELGEKNPKVAEMIWNRLEGKVPEKTENKDDVNITFVNKTKDKSDE